MTVESSIVPLAVTDPLTALMSDTNATPAPLPPSAAGSEPFSFADVRRLTAALRSGEDAAFAWLHTAWSRRINRYCFALAAGDESLAHEIAQATWLRLVRHLRVMPDESALWSWTALAARHSAADLYRKGNRYLRAVGHYARSLWSASLPAAGGPPSGQDDELLACLERCLNHLRPEEGALISGRYFEGVSLEVLGGRHGLSARAVEGRLARVRAKLRDLIANDLPRLGS